MAGEPEIAFVLKGYPRLSETFIAQEIRCLERRGLRILIVSLRRPTDPGSHPVHREIEARVLYLPEYLHDEPRRVAAALWHCLRRHRRGFANAVAQWAHDLACEPTRNRARRFGQALVLAAELPTAVAHLHAHFLHTPASVTAYAATITGRGWTCSAHAKDIWTTPRREIRDKLRRCRWLVTCTRANRDYLRTLAPDPARITLVYHGLDAVRFPEHRAPRAQRRGDAPDDPLRLLSVGRAVEKKGYDVLLQALARLPRDLHWRFAHVGGGPLLAALRSQARELGIDRRIEWLGPLAQEQVLSRYRAADVFVLASRIAGDGDRDGMPNVLLEAMSQRLCCVATTVSAIPELIEPDCSGVLVPPEDPGVLASALAELARDPARRERMGAAASRRVRSGFDVEAAADRLAGMLRHTLQAARTHAA